MNSRGGKKRLWHRSGAWTWSCLLLVMLCSAGLPPLRSQPRFSPSGPDAAAFGAGRHFPVGDRNTWREKLFLVGSFSRYDSIFPSSRVTRAASAWQFSRDSAEPTITYAFAGKTHTLDAYLARFPVTGILLLHGNTILLERYQYGRTDADRFMSASMSKSILSLLAGVALGEGRLKSLDDHVSRYVPELNGTAYGETSLRALLQMSSGIVFDETVDGIKRDTNTRRLIDGLFTPGANPVEVLADCTKRAFPAGTHFDYSSGDNEALGIVLRRATGKSLSEYLSEKIWQPIGTEADATWWVDTSGQEFPSSGFNAVLRDYARLGRLLADDGVWHGCQIVPKSFLLEATTIKPSNPHLAPGRVTPYYGYGYQIWVFPGEERMFVLRGSNSQYVFVHPRLKLVLVQTAVHSEGPDSENGHSECMALWLSIVEKFEREPAR